MTSLRLVVDWRWGGAVLCGLLLIAGCGRDSPSRTQAFLPPGGSSSLWPVPPDLESVTLGEILDNTGTEDVTITGIEAVSEGITVTPRFLQGTPRATGGLSGSAHFPPPEEVAGGDLVPFRVPFVLPVDPETPHEPNTFTDGENWGMVVIFEAEPEATFSVVEGYEIRGTRGGDAFEHFIRIDTVVCTDMTASREISPGITTQVSEECRGFARSKGIVA